MTSRSRRRLNDFTDTDIRNQPLERNGHFCGGSLFGASVDHELFRDTTARFTDQSFR